MTTTNTEQGSHLRPLLTPRHWPSWLLMGLGWLVSQLPYRVQMWLGAKLGTLAARLVPRRRHIAAVNLKLGYPELTETQRHELLAAQFRSVGQGAMETGICWWGSQEKIDRLTHIEGQNNLEEAASRGRGIILLSAHTTSLEIGVRMLGPHLAALGYPSTAMYKPPHDPVVRYVMQTRREKHAGRPIISVDDVSSLLSALRRGEAIWYAADQRSRDRLSIEAEFLGQPAQTHTAIRQLARMTKATILPTFTLRRHDGQGYRLIIKPPLSDFPTSDEAADIRHLNAMIENLIQDDPAQYFWLHRRFKREGYDPYK